MSMEEAMTPFVLYFGEMKLFLKNEAMKPYFKIGKMKPITPPKIILKMKPVQSQSVNGKATTLSWSNEATFEE